MYDENEIKTIHRKLYSGVSLKIGEIQWYISKADFEMEKKDTLKELPVSCLISEKK